jgi:thiol-disulfide isomerase/thioredoxin
MKYLAGFTLGLLSLTCTATAQVNKADSIFIAKCMELSNLENPRRKLAITAEVKKFVRRGDEKSLLSAASVFYFMGMPIQSDSIYMVAAKKYPRGEAAMTVAFSQILRMEDKPQELVTAFQKTAARFPKMDTSSDLTNRIRAHIASAYFKEKDTLAMNTWLSAVKDTLLRSNTEMDLAAWALDEGDTAAARLMMTRGIDKVAGFTASHPDYAAFKMSCLMNYADFLFRLNAYPESLKAIKEVYDSSSEKTPELQKIYATILVANKQGGEALDILAALIKEGQGDEKLKESLKQAYLQAKGAQDGYDNYLQELTADMKSKLVKDTQLAMLNEKSPLFTLRGLEGDTVSLEKLRGKVVILDFWATWCGPCKKSFPSMKAAINKYEADKEVVFLFIDCMEKVQNVNEQISRFLTSHQYPFHVLLATETDVPDQFGIKGIPNKIIIDKNGTIRYRIVGFGEGDDAAVEKLSLMIEATRKAG